MNAGPIIACGENGRERPSSRFAFYANSTSEAKRLAIDVELAKREIDRGGHIARSVALGTARVSLSDGLFAADAVAWLFVAAGAGFVPLAARGVPDGVPEAVECLLKAFAFANLNAAWQSNASSRLTRGW
jgi:hypothetical protein